MIFHHIDIIPYNIDLKRVLTNSQETYSTKSGFIIKLSIDSYVGFGEASPLKDFSKENLRQIMWGFEEFKMSLVENAKYNKDEFFNLIKIYADEIPSLHFALDTAFYDILSQKSSLSMAKYFNPSSFNEIKMGSMYLSGFISENNNIKIKIPCNNFKSDILFLEKVFKQYNDNTLFRIDFNRGYNLKDTLYICDFLSQFNIEYIEEPLMNMSVDRLKILKNKTDIKIAMDESIYKDDFKKLVESGSVDYAILKPAIYGGIEKIFKLYQYFKSNKINMVLSSSLENYIGNMATINLAAALKLPFSHGINNQIFFNYDSDLLYDDQTINLNLENIIGLGVSWNDS